MKRQWKFLRRSKNPVTGDERYEFYSGISDKYGFPGPEMKYAVPVDIFWGRVK